ncbi:hypothetical protein BOX15_Mlig007012g1 [Macrostomum lignano]|uniref:C2H2-type domain-containing protein n=1 Tax=Macrostomum lignano TaxID=282301 RepID=A0A267G266_9PLAT|nr:hypothetical protein BOX15_Mlig007012g1 [Macrostomum lignano]
MSQCSSPNSLGSSTIPSRTSPAFEDAATLHQQQRNQLKFGISNILGSNASHHSDKNSSTVSSFSPPNASVAMTTSANATAVELAWKHYERQHREQQQQMLMMYSYWNALQPTGACEATPYPYIPGTSQQQPQPQQLQIQFVNNGNGVKNPLAEAECRRASGAQRGGLGAQLPNGQYECRICQKRFSLQRLLNRHLKCHSTLKRFLCSYCGKGFNDTFDLKRHTRTHTGVRPYKCTECGKAFTQRCSLESHARKLHGRALGFGHKERREKLHVCELCGHSTACARQHLSHAKQHQQAERPASSAATEEATLWQLFQAAASGLNLHT